MKVLALLIFFVCIQLAYPTPWSHSVDEDEETSHSLIKNIFNPVKLVLNIPKFIIRRIINVVLLPLKIVIFPVKVVLQIVLLPYRFVRWILKILLFPLRALSFIIGEVFGELMN
ncbi:uncharacterized protein LOC112904545 isoform X1 [Agrilus planipennis]|uniref:Uncharacterized protein LOC112904545 isoform X1 n=1 Tax=Agrilus planipennis TaxID=224129 RepID=A0A7F5R4Q4_AGRPL|nr:uncharacterized protein LOC112904545 isoform X1 [Agrilus planipennis]